MKSNKPLKQITNLFENYTELLLVTFGVLSLFMVFVFPVRLDIKLLLGGFGFYLVAAGILARFIARKS